MSPRALFRRLAFAEAVTWTLLIAGMVQKYLLEAGDWGVRIGGGLHGLVFLAFGATTLLVAVNQRWTAGVTLGTLAASVVPWATVPAEVMLERSGRLAGPWRYDAVHGPGVLDRLLGRALARPLVAGGVAVIGVLVTFGVLLVLGPPVGREG